MLHARIFQTPAYIKSYNIILVKKSLSACFFYPRFANSLLLTNSLQGRQPKSLKTLLEGAPFCFERNLGEIRGPPAG